MSKSKHSFKAHKKKSGKSNSQKKYGERLSDHGEKKKFNKNSHKKSPWRDETEREQTYKKLAEKRGGVSEPVQEKNLKGPQGFLSRISKLGQEVSSANTRAFPRDERRRPENARPGRVGDYPRKSEQNRQDHRGFKNQRNKNKRGPVRVVKGEVQKNSRGFAFLLQKPEDIFIPPNFAAPLLTGDHVEVVVSGKENEVVDLKITKRAMKSFIGTYHAGFDQRMVMLTDRTMREEVKIIEAPKLPGLRHGNKVQVEITKYEPRLEGRVVRDFGAELAPKFDTLSVVIKSQWPQEFSEEVKNQAAKLSKEIQEEESKRKYSGRKDLRNKPFVTIDGKDARDFDDAILVEKTASGYVLYVAIADVSEFVTPGTKLDDEAYGRATSVYFPEWVIPMLPEALSNGACSLRPDEEKLTLTCEMHYDQNGKKRSIKVYESVIKSHRRCIYEDVYKEFKDGNSFWTVPFELYELIKASRFKRGSLDLDLPESKIVLDENSEVIDIKKVERLDSHRLIEEFMIAANESVTELMEREGWPFLYRIHEPPQAAARERFENFAQALGLRPKLGDGSDPRLFAQFISTLKDHPFNTTLYYLMLRSLKQARYDITNLKHFGLASKAYTHFTSPIRRYPDLMVHRILKRYSRHESFSEQEHDEYVDYLADACDHCSKLERKAEELDRTVTKVKKARFMAKHFGEVFHARITNVSEAGLFIELKKWFVEGLVPIDELGSDYFEYFEEKMMLKGKRSGKKFKIGDEVSVAVLRTDIDNGFIDFTLAEEDETIQDE